MSSSTLCIDTISPFSSLCPRRSTTPTCIRNMDGNQSSQTFSSLVLVFVVWVQGFRQALTVVSASSINPVCGSKRNKACGVLFGPAPPPPPVLSSSEAALRADGARQPWLFSSPDALLLWVTSVQALLHLQ